MVNLEGLDSKNIFELRLIAKELGIQSATKYKKSELIDRIIKVNSKVIQNELPAKVVSESTQKKETEHEEKVFETAGQLEIMHSGYGFLRCKSADGSNEDIYVSLQKIKSFKLKNGDFVVANCKHTIDSKQPALTDVISINGMKFEDIKNRVEFDNLIPIYPNSRLVLESSTSSTDFAIRCIDLVAPIGKGQRAMIVAPPKAGKTTLLKSIANAISTNYPDVELIVLLIDERPEEVTDMQRSIKGSVVYSTFDELPENHTKTAEKLLEAAKRKVEMGKDVVILMDSLTRLARAYNLTVPPTGRTLSGGIDPGALHSPKRFFGSARNIENGGSLTIIATALVDTGSRMDDVIFEEFKGTGNMEIHLSRNLSEKRIFPAIDLAKSGTRKEELLLSKSELESTWFIRKLLTDNPDAIQLLLKMIVKTKTNKEFIDTLMSQINALKEKGFDTPKNN